MCTVYSTYHFHFNIHFVSHICNKIFLGLLAENGRIKNLNVIINSFKIIMAAHRGDLQCVVTTAKVYYKFNFENCI